MSIQAGTVGKNEKVGEATALDPMVKYMQDYSRFTQILQQLEFNNPNIRNAFLKGEIIKNPNSEIIVCIEFVQKLVLPTHIKLPLSFISDLDRI